MEYPMIHATQHGDLSALSRADVEAALAGSRKEERDILEAREDCLTADGAYKDARAKQTVEDLMIERRKAIKTAERLEARLDTLPPPPAAPEVGGVFNADDLPPSARFFMFGQKRLSESERKEFCEDFRSAPPFAGAQGFKINLYEEDRALAPKSLQTMKTDTGRTYMALEPGAAVEPIVFPGLVNRLSQFGDAAMWCRQFMTPWGTDLTITNLDDASKKGETIPKNGTATEEDLSDFTQVTFEQYRATSKAMDVHRYTLRDVRGFSVEQSVRGSAMRRIGRTVNEQVTTGTGNNLPRGILPSAGLGDVVASKTAFTAKEMTNLRYSVPRPYWSGDPEGKFGYTVDPNSGATGYMVSSDAEKNIITMEDNDRRPIYVPSLVMGLPDTWNGWPITVNDNLPAFGANATPVVFGAFRYMGFRVIAEAEFWAIFDGSNLLADTQRYLANYWYDSVPVGALSAGNSRTAYVSEAFFKMRMPA